MDSLFFFVDCSLFSCVCFNLCEYVFVDFLWVSSGFRMVFSGILVEFLSISCGSLVDFFSISYGLLVDFLWVSSGFLLDFF